MKTIGCDPEFFVKINNNYTKAANINVPTKEDSKENKGFRVFRDNVLLEINQPPSDNLQEFQENLRNSFILASEFGRIYAKSAVVFNKDILNSKEDYEIGCHEEKCAYTLETIDSRNLYKKNHTRTGGGHIHLGTDGDFYYNLSLVRMLDLLFSCTLIQLEKEDESSTKRRKLYGYPGRFRFTKYGIEYRVLSNYWLRSQELTSFVYKLCDHACDLTSQDYINLFWEVDKKKIESLDFSDLNTDPIVYHNQKFDFQDLSSLFNKVKYNKLSEKIKKMLTQELKSDFLELESALKDEDILRNWFNI